MDEDNEEPSVGINPQHKYRQIEYKRLVFLQNMEGPHATVTFDVPSEVQKEILSLEKKFNLTTTALSQLLNQPSAIMVVNKGYKPRIEVDNTDIN